MIILKKNNNVWITCDKNKKANQRNVLQSFPSIRFCCKKKVNVLTGRLCVKARHESDSETALDVVFMFYSFDLSITVVGSFFFCFTMWAK